MAKATGPLMSIDARGTVGKAVTFSNWKGKSVVKRHFVPHNPNSTGQGNMRALITAASEAWKNESTVGGIAVDSAYKASYIAAAQGTPVSGFNMFIRDCVALNFGASFDGSLTVPASTSLVSGVVLTQGAGLTATLNFVSITEESITLELYNVGYPNVILDTQTETWGLMPVEWESAVTLEENEQYQVRIKIAGYPDILSNQITIS